MKVNSVLLALLLGIFIINFTILLALTGLFKTKQSKTEYQTTDQADVRQAPKKSTEEKQNQAEVRPGPADKTTLTDLKVDRSFWSPYHSYVYLNHFPPYRYQRTVRLGYGGRRIVRIYSRRRPGYYSSYYIPNYSYRLNDSYREPLYFTPADYEDTDYDYSPGNYTLNTMPGNTHFIDDELWQE